jgi:hypothetical protein
MSKCFISYRHVKPDEDLTKQMKCQLYQDYFGKNL